MELAKDALDIGLFTEDWDAMRAFYVDELGLDYEEALPTGGGVLQHRLSFHGGVLKINHSRNPLPHAPGGYDALELSHLSGPGARRDPDGLSVVLTDGAPGVRIRQRVGDLDATNRFYEKALGCEQVGPGHWRLATTEFVLEPGLTGRSGPLRARGWRYLTIQVRDVRAEHEQLVALGVEEGMPVTRLGDVAVISFIRDPDGNWIEISQRASLTGPLPG